MRATEHCHRHSTTRTHAIARLPRTSRLPRCTRCIERFTTLDALPRLELPLHGVLFREVANIPR